jgi:hypothetical protein
MRTIGIFAIFLLSLTAIAEGAYLFKLSRQVSALSEERARPSRAVSDDSGSLLTAPRQESEPRPARGAREPAPPLPNFQALAPASTTPATATLREALSTTEGRDQLKAALEVIAEEKRQDRLLRQAGRRDEREQHFKDRILKNVPLTGDEPLKVNALFATLQTGRHQLLEDMKAGLKSADQADEAIDELQDNTEKSVRTLIGEERWRKLREADRRERRGGQGQGGEGRGQGQGQGNQGQQAPQQGVASGAR